MARVSPPTDDDFFFRETCQGDYTRSIAVSTGTGGAVRILGQSSKKGYNESNCPEQDRGIGQKKKSGKWEL
jgi:hypothetical protein